MKKFFLIPLMTLVCSVMAWGETIYVGEDSTYPATAAGLNSAIAAASAGDVIELTSDIAYATNGTGLINITKSITLDGKGHKLSGWGKCDVKMGSAGTPYATTIAINSGVVGSNLDVTIKNLSLGNTTSNERYYGILAFDGVAKLTYDNIEVVCGNYRAQQTLCFTGTNATPIVLTIKDSHLNSGISAYPIYILKPITANISNTKIEGWCAIYPKYRATDLYGTPVGSRGSNITCDACTFYCPNSHVGTSNSFAMFPIEDDGITLNLHNCSANAERFTEQYQMIVSLQYGRRAEGTRQPVNVTISGDNSHFYNVDLEWFALSGWNDNDDTNHLVYNTKYKDAPLHMTITGGTFTVNPSQIKFRNWNNEGTEIVWENASIDPAKYELKEISQGGVPVWRVVPVTTTLYNLNSDVPTDPVEGAGQNPNTSFDLSTGSEMTLNQATTKAGYVEVKDNGSSVATVVKVGKTENPGTPSETKIDQTLIVNNGLDVQGNSKVDVQAGSTLVIGKGGIVTEDPKNIVIEADRAGAASLIMDPAITVNQTPNLTVRMTAKQIGKTLDGEFWHRFAMPVQHANSWDKEGSLGTGNDKYPTFLYGWNYSTDSWYKLPGGVSDMQAFMGYTLRLATEEIAATDELQDVVYIFKGQLAGNTNNTLQFSRNGYNFFGNSYTGYIDLKQLVAQITGDSKIEGTAWVWDTKNQRYQDVPLNLLAAGTYDNESDKWKTEIAPMQTFILKQNGSNNASTEINYASAVWGNPRYSAATGVSAAPARRVANMNTTRMYIAVTAANGQSDEVFFVEDANYSDAFDNGYDASKYMNPNTINVFANQNGIDLGTVASDNLNGKTLSLNTNGELAYTMSFKNVEGEEYAIRDNVTGAVINIEEGATYEFAAQPNSTIEGRFEIVAIAKLPTAIENTEVKANVKGIYTIMGQYLGENFDILPAGVYVVDGVKIVK